MKISDLPHQMLVCGFAQSLGSGPALKSVYRRRSRTVRRRRAAVRVKRLDNDGDEKAAFGKSTQNAVK